LFEMNSCDGDLVDWVEMPELPEVERVRKIFDRVLTGKVIAEAEVVPDEIVLKGVDPAAFFSQLSGATVTGTGRKGKYWWLELGDRGCLFGHLGMAGWVREIGMDTVRIREQGNAPLDDEAGRPRFLKLRLRADDGREVVMTDGRRLARLWQGSSADQDEKVSALGRDSYTDLATVDELYAMLKKRKAPMKAILLDQKAFCGVGNWIADEVLYHAGIAPKRLGSSLTLYDVEVLREKLWWILDVAVQADADKDKFPPDWLFHSRWGGGKGEEFFHGEQLIREQVGGRTTAWVPSRQK
jgi:formamidopyrimidine-DNA glycosylase